MNSPLPSLRVRYVVKVTLRALMVFPDKTFTSKNMTDFLKTRDEIHRHRSVALALKDLFKYGFLSREKRHVAQGYFYSITDHFESVKDKISVILDKSNPSLSLKLI